MATDNRPDQARRSRQCTRYTPLARGIHSLDSRAFQKKGCLVFSWMDTIQKKPQEMEISLRKNGALKAETQGRDAAGVVHSLCVLSWHGPCRYRGERRRTPLEWGCVGCMRRPGWT